MDMCGAWEAWHGGSEPLFLAHAQLRHDRRPRRCNATAGAWTSPLDPRPAKREL